MWRLYVAFRRIEMLNLVLYYSMIFCVTSYLWWTCKWTNYICQCGTKWLAHVFHMAHNSTVLFRCCMQLFGYFFVVLWHWDFVLFTEDCVETSGLYVAGTCSFMPIQNHPFAEVCIWSLWSKRDLSDLLLELMNWGRNYCTGIRKSKNYSSWSAMWKHDMRTM